MSSKDKICLHEREKHPPPALQGSPAEDEEEEAPTGPSQPQSPGKASSSSSSEVESESESDAESGERSCSAAESGFRCLMMSDEIRSVSLTGIFLTVGFLIFAEKAKNRELINNLNNKRNTSSLLPTSMPTSPAAIPAKKVPYKGGGGGAHQALAFAA